MTSVLEKVCACCQRSFPKTTEFFYIKLKRGKPTFGTRCKDCLKTEAVVRWRKRYGYQGNPPPAKKSPEEKRATRSAARRRARQRNPEKYRVKERQKRARRAQASGRHTWQDVQKQLDQQNGLCYWCRGKLETVGEKKYHVDHLIALAKGGSNGPENIVCACPDCNGTKSDKMPWEFAGRLI